MTASIRAQFDTYVERFRNLEPDSRDLKILSCIPIVSNIALMLKKRELVGPQPESNREGIRKFSAISSSMARWSSIQRIIALAAILFISTSWAVTGAILLGLAVTQIHHSQVAQQANDKAETLPTTPSE